MNSIGKRIKYIRNDCNLNQIEFAEVLGVTNAHISRLEKDVTVPSEALTKLICKAFDVSEDWLKTGKEPIYIDEEQIDDLMFEATQNSNKSFKLNENNKLLRTLLAEAHLIFSEILELDGLDEEIQKMYLRSIINIFKIINQFSSELKENILTKQMIIEFAREDKALSYSMEIKKEIDDLSNILSLLENTVK